MEKVSFLLSFRGKDGIKSAKKTVHKKYQVDFPPEHIPRESEDYKTALLLQKIGWEAEFTGLS